MSTAVTSRVRSLAVALAIGAAVAITALPAGRAEAGSSGVTAYPVADRGFSSPVHGATSHAGSSGASSSLQHGSRQRTATASAHASTAQAPQASASTSSVTSSVLHNFNGVSSLDSAQTNFGLEFQPPDQGLCVGNGFVLEPVNSAYRIYKPNGSTIIGPFNVNDIFNEGAEEFTSDPRCYFDPTTNTWFAIILFIAADNSASHLDVAVLPGGDPTKLWTEYRFDTTHAGGNGCPCFGDQPHLGIDAYNVYVSTDEFSILGPEFNGAQIYAFSKADMVAGNAAHFVHFGPLSVGGSLAVTIEPAFTTGAQNAEYFMNSIDPNGTFNNKVGVWALTDQNKVSTGGSPELSSAVITTEPFGLPPQADQKGSSIALDSGDDRMQQTQYISGHLWGELTSAVTIAGDSAERAGAAWFEVTPSLSGDDIGNVTVANQGYVVKKGENVIYPALQVDPAGRGAMGFTLSSATRFPSTAYVALGTGQTSFGPIKVTANGTGPYLHHAHNRWGDYGWATWDPATDTFWLATEYIPAKSSQTTDRINNWGTRLVNVSVK
jgi:hypothetical protein